MILKRWVEGDLEECRGWVEREADVLVALESCGLEAPRLVARSLGAETDGIPTLLMTRLPGRVWLTPDEPSDWIRQMARTLATIHSQEARVELPATSHPERTFRVPHDARRPELWLAARDRLLAPAPVGKSLIHGDYQHFNLLWSRRRLSGVIDWTWAGLGHPDRDVGHCRLNLAVLFSADWAHEFSAAYRAESGRPIDPWWDLFEICLYSDAWPRFIPVQVGGRATVDTVGMTDRVEDLLAAAVG
jgi:aminoglycoside phosphotransferase (APT) family kinase protein